jgi:DNA replication protein DnaC
LGWFVLIGAPSTGKTHLAAAIAHERRAMGEQVIMTTCSELIDYLRAAFGGANSARFTRRMAELRTVPLLVLDNLIIDETTPAWVRERLHEILISRFDVGLPTVLTMYMTTDSLDERIGTRIKNKARCMVPSMKIPAYKGNVSPRRAAQAKY